MGWIDRVETWSQKTALQLEKACSTLERWNYAFTPKNPELALFLANRAQFDALAAGLRRVVDAAQAEVSAPSSVNATMRLLVPGSFNSCPGARESKCSTEPKRPPPAAPSS